MAKPRRQFPCSARYSDAASEFVRVAVEAITEGLRRSAGVAEVSRSASPDARRRTRTLQDVRRPPGQSLH